MEDAQAGRPCHQSQGSLHSSETAVPPNKRVTYARRDVRLTGFKVGCTTTISGKKTFGANQVPNWNELASA